MGPQDLKTPVIFFLSFLVILLLTSGLAQAQAIPPGPAMPKGRPAPRNIPPKVKPTQKPKTIKDIDEARLRRKRKEERDKKNESPNTPPARPQAPQAPSVLKLSFEPVDKSKIKVVSTSYKIEARRGEKPFTVFTIQLANATDSYVSALDLTLNAKNVSALAKTDLRKIPSFPLKLERFCGANALAAPVPPRSRQTLSFVYPFAIKKPSLLKASLGSVVQFKPIAAVNFSPVKVVRWTTSPTKTAGKDHLGLFVTLKNLANYPVDAQLKISLGEVASAGGNTFFLTQAALKSKETKTIILRSIPDEGRKAGHPKRNLLPAHFSVRNVEVTDLKF